MNKPPLPLLAVLLAVLLLSACASYSSDPDIAMLERAAARAPKDPTPPAYMTPEEMYPNNPQAQALVRAAVRGNVKEIDRLIDAGVDPNAVGAFGKTVPGWVLFHPNVAGFRRLLERGADPNKIWYDGTHTQSSLLHMAVYMSDRIGIDYLEMCLKIGKGNPNLEPPDGKERPIALAIQASDPSRFFILVRVGADIFYTIKNKYWTKTLADIADSYSNYRVLLYLLQKGVEYNSDEGGYFGIHYCFNLTLGDYVARDPKHPSYMWFWRCVDLLEKRGMKFHYGIAIRPAVLDTTPPDILGPEANK
jgi:hypothetical protein